MKHLTIEEIEASLGEVFESPKDNGVLNLICRRQSENEREVLETGELDIEKGLVGDDWLRRDGKYETQLTIMNSRIIDLIAQDENRWKLAGDQLFVDLNLTDENLPHGTQLQIGSAIIEVTPQPHNGCKKFVERFGLDAMKFVNSPIGKQFHLRGIYAKVVQSGTIRQGDIVKKIERQNMKKFIIDVPDAIYERAVKMAETLNISLDEFFEVAVEKYLEKRNDKVMEQD
jgi:MOSC domain-containing protein YiiM